MYTIIFSFISLTRRNGLHYCYSMNWAKFRPLTENVVQKVVIFKSIKYKKLTCRFQVHDRAFIFWI